jgi:hypothetical protein
LTILDVREDYLHPDFCFQSGRKMQFDIYFPAHSLVIEYQGEQHYHDVYSLGPQWLYMERDIEKRILCQENGITLIEIPYWWDGTKESIQATIHKQRPDLVNTAGNGQPIPTQPPKGIKGDCSFF